MRKHPNWFVLSIPLLLSLGSIAYLSEPREVIVGQAAVFLAPARTNEALILGLVIFSAAYVIFLIALFSEDIKEFVHKVQLRRH